MQKIYYWSPCLTKVGTHRSTINSAISLAKYSDKNFKVSIINTCGEWSQSEKLLIENNVEILSFGYNYFKYLPKSGFLGSRISYLVIILTSIIPLLRLIKKKEPNYIIIHLLTSLPLLLLKIFNFKTNFILRISGYPKLKYLRKILWKSISNKIFKVTCPSKELLKQLDNLKFFSQEKLFFLPDPIIDVKEIKKIKKSKEIFKNEFKGKNYFISAGRLTKQKNFEFLIVEFKKFCEEKPNYNLLIFGEGEDKSKLLRKIYKYNFEKKIHLMGYTNNIYGYMKDANAFILSSLWEDPGFVLIESAMCNLFIISSNCKNGPSEFLDNGNGGLLFESNKNNALKEALDKFLIITNLNEKKILAKKNCKKYTIFRHFNLFKQVLS